MDKLMKAISSMNEDAGRKEDDRSLPPGIEAMLAGASSAHGATSGPLGFNEKYLMAMLGGDSELSKQAAQIWKHMDHLADTDPQGYQSFLQKQAAAATSLPAGPGKTAKPKGPSDGGASKSTKATFLASTTQLSKRPGKKAKGVEVEVVVGVHRARTSIGLFPAGSGGSVEVRELELPYQTSEPASLGLPPSSLQGAAGIISTTTLVYSIECHPADLDKAVKDPQFCGLVLESVFLWIEREHQVALSRVNRRLYTLAGEVPEEVLKTAAAKTACQSLGVESSPRGIQNLSNSLLHELATLAEPQRLDPVKKSNPVAEKQLALIVKKALIQEVETGHKKAPAPEYTMEVITVEDGKQMVSVVVSTPNLSSAAEADLEVAREELVLVTGAGTEALVLSLPIPVDPNSIRAKLDKKRGRLKIFLPGVEVK